MAVEHGGRTTRTVGWVLIHIALLSTASGWKLTSNDEEEEADFLQQHAPMITGGVSSARDRRRLASNCNSDCDSDCDSCIGCTTGCDDSCNFFGGCDGSCDENCNGGCNAGCDGSCDGSCDTGCSA